MDRKKEVIGICLDHFVENGLSDTSTRSLSKALKLQNAGLYYYFESKDEAVIACADEAAIRLENTLIAPALRDISDPDLMMKRLQSRVDEMAPTMQFLVSVCSNKRYQKAIKPALDRLAERYQKYAMKLAEKINCPVKDVEPYFFMTITAVTNYMIFREDSYIFPQMKVVKTALKELTKNQ